LIGLLTNFNSYMRRISPYLTTGGFLLLALVLSIAFGAVFIPPADLWRILCGWIGASPIPDSLQTFTIIILAIRLPRTVLVALAGAALGGSGASYQGLFRNPLADPYLIGVASGAGLGAVIAMSLAWPYGSWSTFIVPAMAFIAALGTIFLVYVLARVGKTVPTTNLILAGVAFSFFASALTSFIMLHSKNDLRRPLIWLLGGMGQTGWQPVLGSLPYIALGLTGLILSGHALNVLQFGDEQAQQLGLPVNRAKTIILIAASLSTAAAVAFSGIIGFIGLIVPHVMRMWFGNDYRRLIPLSIITGAGALLVADVLARVVMAPQELPVGIITALVGVPFFLWVLRRAKSQGTW
jgi:iron complex transport system permease protein